MTTVVLVRGHSPSGHSLSMTVDEPARPPRMPAIDEAGAVGLTPIGIGIPGGEEGPIVLDVALGATAHGKIRV